MIRHAQPEDLAAIVEIYNATVPTRMSTADTEPVTVESRVPWLAAHSPQRRPLWVAEVDGTVGGWLSLSDFKARPGYAGTVELGVYVDERHRGRGLGRRLVEHAIANAPALGITTVLALVFAHNATSVGLLRSAGFERFGLLPQVVMLDGKPADVLVLGRRTQ